MQCALHALDVIVALNSCVRRSAGMTCVTCVSTEGQRSKAVLHFS